MSNALLRELAVTRATFQLRAIKAVMCISARPKTDQETQSQEPTNE